MFCFLVRPFSLTFRWHLLKRCPHMIIPLSNECLNFVLSTVSSGKQQASPEVNICTLWGFSTARVPLFTAISDKDYLLLCPFPSKSDKGMGPGPSVSSRSRNLSTNWLCLSCMIILWLWAGVARGWILWQEASVEHKVGAEVSEEGLLSKQNYRSPLWTPVTALCYRAAIHKVCTMGPWASLIPSKGSKRSKLFS